MSYDRNAFVSRQRQSMSSGRIDMLRVKGILDEDDSDGADDWIEVYREGSDIKYGRFMYSKTLDRLRHQTMGEFYGSGIVD